MRLQDLAGGNVPAIAVAAIGADKALAAQIQDRLTDAGLLEPPADGSFGPISHWALGAFLARIGTPDKQQLDKAVAAELLSPGIDQLFPLKDAATLAGSIARAMAKKGWWITRHPDCVNIVYVEGLNPDGTANDNAPNVFNDLRVVLKLDAAGTPEIAGQWVATSEPGRFYTKIKPLDPRGAARIAFGQYKAWSVGLHPQSKPATAHEALVQVKDVTVHRDLNKDFKRTGDATFTGMFGINQHWGYNLPIDDIGNASAGCLVGRLKAEHREFMALVKADPRYGVSRGFHFMTAVMPASDLS